MYNETTLQLDDIVIRKGKNIFRAINHPLRQQILHLLHKRGNMIVTDIYHSLEIEQSVASQHLAILRQAAIVNAKRAGKRVHYSVNYQRIRHIHAIGLRLLA
jgi:DNA-binding transcriptional ArsR family regulator